MFCQNPGRFQPAPPERRRPPVATPRHASPQAHTKLIITMRGMRARKADLLLLVVSDELRGFEER